MSVPLALGYLDKPYQIWKADSGAIRFRVTNNRANPVFLFLSKECPHKALYQITLKENSTLYDLRSDGDNVCVAIPNFSSQNTHEFWLTWYNDEICMGRLNEPALLQYSEKHTKEPKQIIGFIKFMTMCYDNDGIVEWSLESTPHIYTPIEIPKKVSGGKLRWVSMRTGDLLPTDAMIAGYEMEPLYIARAEHRGSLCPGKYIKSKQHAYIPWGHSEYSKSEFEILCGYDAMWVKCSGNQIPENAFIGGTSEVRDEPLFIGRAMIRNHLVNGKVHLMYKTCYLPYKGREVNKSVYEILVTTHSKPRGESCDPLCYMSMIMKPCI